MAGSFEYTQDRIGSLTLLQPARGYRFSIDSLLLAEFAAPKKYDHILDLGCGCGVISLLIAQKFPNTQIVGIEIQEELAQLAEKNVEINQMEECISIIQGDLKDIKKYIKAGEFDYVISNPPFRPAQSGRICPDRGEAIARHEIAAGLEAFLDAARYALHPGGRLSVIYPAEMTAKLIKAMCGKKIEPKRMGFIHPSKGKNARMVLVEGCKDAGTEVKVLPPIFLDGHHLQGGRQTSQG